MPAFRRRIMAAVINFRKVWPAFVLLILPAALAAQQPALTLDAILTRVRANIAEFQTSVPNFAVDESIDSQRILGGRVKEETRIQSSFRITSTDRKSTRLNSSH